MEQGVNWDVYGDVYGTYTPRSQAIGECGNRAVFQAIKNPNDPRPPKTRRPRPPNPRRPEPRKKIRGPKKFSEKNLVLGPAPPPLPSPFTRESTYA